MEYCNMNLICMTRENEQNFIVVLYGIELIKSMKIPD